MFGCQDFNHMHNAHLLHAAVIDAQDTHGL